jgi:hypothetical protein
MKTLYEQLDNFLLNYLNCGVMYENRKCNVFHRKRGGICKPPHRDWDQEKCCKGPGIPGKYAGSYFAGNRAGHGSPPAGSQYRNAVPD